jgi:hypothetical protein
VIEWRARVDWDCAFSHGGALLRVGVAQSAGPSPVHRLRRPPARRRCPHIEPTRARPSATSSDRHDGGKLARAPSCCARSISRIVRGCTRCRLIRCPTVSP